MRYYRGCLIRSNYELVDARGLAPNWAAWSVEGGGPLLLANSLRLIYRRIDELLGSGVRVKCECCDDYGIVTSIVDGEVKCECGLADRLDEMGVSDVSSPRSRSDGQTLARTWPPAARP